jgi:hypothetical protein
MAVVFSAISLPPRIAVWRLYLMAALLVAWRAGAQTVRYGVDLNGEPVTEIVHPETRALVLIFAASDCPISNRYVPEMTDLQREFGNRGVQFWQVYPNTGETAAAIRQHRSQFGDLPDIVLDTDQTLVRMAHVTITPEAAVFVRDASELREVYHGRIDDRYLDLGSERPRVLHRDLENAITSVLGNIAVHPPGGPAVGCTIVMRRP